MPRNLPTAADPIPAAEFADAFASLSDAGTVLAAVSGGPDSVALLHALARWSTERAHPRAVAAATVDHALRPDSRSEAETVAAISRRLGIAHAILTWDRGGGGSASQDAARGARYRLLLGHAEAVGATHLLTAHTLDDQAETVLMRIAAGTGIAGLAAMSAASRRGGIVHARPFLHFGKARLVQTCRAEGWSFIEDPTNADARFARPRWRRLMPALATEGLNARRLARLAARAARADAALAGLAGTAFDRLSRQVGPATLLDADALAREPTEIALRVLAAAVGTAADSAHAAAPSPLRLERLEACLEAVLAARSSGHGLRRTLAGRLLHLDRTGTLAISPEPPRHRGRVPSLPPTSHADEPDRPRA